MQPLIEHGTRTSVTSRTPGQVVVLRRDLGDFGDPAPRPLRRRTALTLAGPLLRPVTVTFCVQTDEQVVSLTYDDGPDPAHTPGLLDLLAGSSPRGTRSPCTAPTTPGSPRCRTPRRSR
jgi:hypothetical protein